MKAPRRTTAPGTARKPASRNARLAPALELRGTLSTTAGLAGVPMTALSLSRNDSSTAFLSPLPHRPDLLDLLRHAQLRRCPGPPASRPPPARSALCEAGFRPSRRCPGGLDGGFQIGVRCHGVSSQVSPCLGRRLEEGGQLGCAVVHEASGGGWRREARPAPWSCPASRRARGCAPCPRRRRRCRARRRARPRCARTLRRRLGPGVRRADVEDVLEQVGDAQPREHALARGLSSALVKTSRRPGRRARAAVSAGSGCRLVERHVVDLVVVVVAGPCRGASSARTG